MKHTDIINTILSAEQEARNLTAEARARQVRLDEDLARKATDIREAVLARARRRVERREGEEQAYTKERVKELRGERESALREMEAVFSAHRAEWTDTIFKKVIQT